MIYGLDSRRPIKPSRNDLPGKKNYARATFAAPKKGLMSDFNHRIFIGVKSFGRIVAQVEEVEALLLLGLASGEIHELIDDFGDGISADKGKDPDSDDGSQLRKK